MAGNDSTGLVLLRQMSFYQLQANHWVPRKSRASSLPQVPFCTPSSSTSRTEVLVAHHEGWLYNLENIGCPCLFVQGAELLQSTPGYWLYGSCWFSHPLACLLGSQGVYLVSSSVSGAQEVLNKYLFNEDIENGGTSEIDFVEWISKFFLF